MEKFTEYNDIEKIFSEDFATTIYNVEPGFNKVSDVIYKPIMGRWYEAKKKFIDCFSGGSDEEKLIYVYPEKVTFKIGEHERQQYTQEILQHIKYAFNANEDLIDFLQDNKDSLLSNILEKDYQNDKFKIRKGMKITKAIKMFDNDIERVRGMQDYISRFVQKSKMSGYLCLSVHPLDYITVSDNNSWTSCHSMDEGCYHGGNLSYMLDSSTVVCYLVSDLDRHLIHPFELEWNLKRWRCLLHFSTAGNMMLASKQYPLYINGAYDFLKDKIVGQLFKGKWDLDSPIYITNYESQRKVVQRVNEINSNIFLKEEKQKEWVDFKTFDQIFDENVENIFYNDLTHSNFNRYYIGNGSYSFGKTGMFLNKVCNSSNLSSTSNSKYGFQKDYFEVGEDVPCLKCGNGYVHYIDSLFCDDCEHLYGDSTDDSLGRFCCENCGEFFDEDEMYSTDSGEILCECCYNDLYGYCENCGEDRPRESIIEFSLEEKKELNNGYRYTGYIKRYAFCEDCCNEKLSNLTGFINLFDIPEEELLYSDKWEFRCNDYVKDLKDFLPTKDLNIQIEWDNYSEECRIYNTETDEVIDTWQIVPLL